MEDNSRLLISCARRGDVEGLQKLIPSSEKEHLIRCLAQAAEKGWEEAAAVLAPLCAESDEMGWILWTAVKYRRHGCFEIILPYGDPTSENSDSLYTAALLGRNEESRALIQEAIAAHEAALEKAEISAAIGVDPDEQERLEKRKRDRGYM